MNILFKEDDVVNRKVYQHICENVSDLDNIPSKYISFGSLAYVISTGELYIVNGDKEWQVVK